MEYCGGSFGARTASAIERQCYCSKRFGAVSCGAMRLSYHGQVTGSTPGSGFDTFLMEVQRRRSREVRILRGCEFAAHSSAYSRCLSFRTPPHANGTLHAIEVSTFNLLRTIQWPRHCLIYSDLRFPTYKNCGNNYRRSLKKKKTKMKCLCQLSGDAMEVHTTHELSSSRRSEVTRGTSSCCPGSPETLSHRRATESDGGHTSLRRQDSRGASFSSSSKSNQN